MSHISISWVRSHSYIGPKAKYLSRHNLHRGDILFARRGVQATGQSALVRDEEEGSICGTGAIRLRVKPENNKIHTNFLSHVLMERTSREWLRHNAIGATMPNLNEGIIRRFVFFAPPFDEQVRIADFLDAFDDKIELNRRMNETLEQTARAIFQDWFVDFGPTRAKMEGRETYLAPEVWSEFPDKFDEDELPCGWKRSSLDRILDINPSERLPNGAVAPYLDMTSIPTTGPNADIPTVRPFKSGSKFRNGDTLFARITPCLENGKTAFVHNLPENTIGSGSTEFIVLRSRSPVPAAVSYLIARDARFRSHAIQNMTGTSGRQRADTSALIRFEVAVPPLPRLWHLLDETIRPIFDRIAAADRESRTLAATRDFLLPKLMSGEIRVKDAETLAADVL
ncbi:MAG: restriction endonuclease subunit S [Phyllobacteriaceae bacterium]|nr:restriction endonuclease subunit S [Phyllobacteriaceae bacterium]